MLGIGKEALKVASKGRQDIGPIVVPFCCFLIYVISMRTLVLGDQMKYYIYITLEYGMCQWVFSLISDLIFMDWNLFGISWFNLRSCIFFFHL